MSPPSLHPFLEKSSFANNHLHLRYLQHESGAVGFELIPASKVEERIDLSDRSKRSPALSGTLQPLIGLHLAEDPYPGFFAQGRTLQGSPSACSLAWDSQFERKNLGRYEIVTRLRSTRHALEAEHIVGLMENVSAVTCRSLVRNTGTTPLTLQLLTSFALSGLTPFACDDAPGRLKLHRFRSSWSQEGRLVTDSLEHLHLEPSWTRIDLQSERFGQVGSMPVRGFFPTAILEDERAGVFWGAQLAWPGSWQMEVLRRGDSVALIGGLADIEFGHWQKTLAPGETFESPLAFLTCGTEGLDALCETLIEAQRIEAPAPLPEERDLPVIFNEFCYSWGAPTEESMVAITARLKDSPVKYIVIDAGWFKKGGGPQKLDSLGDWEINREIFPNGFAGLNAAIRANGQIPGIWFEFEVTTEGAEAFAEVSHQLKRQGRVLEVGPRRFWDFRDPWVIDYLSERVIGFLRREGFGYLKVDYNDSIGLGCDSPDGLGEGLRQHLEGVYRFFQKIRQELPDLIMENCASGGHRLEPLMVGITSMSSFSDAHECPEIPWIGANLQRLIPPEKSQIWAVLRAENSRERLHYTLSAGFLGRLCLSGEVVALAPWQWNIALEAMQLYRQIHPIIQNGSSRRFGQEKQNTQHLEGYQAVRRLSAEGNEALVVWHTFASKEDVELEIPLPPGLWKIAGRFNDDGKVEVGEDALALHHVPPFSGGGLHLTRH